jgi:transcriptional regulator with XRE-family HTH domain
MGNTLLIEWKMTDLRKVLASNMKLCRKNLGLSQAKLAEMADITDNYIALIETGKRFPSINMLERIANALQKDSLDLFSIKPLEISAKKALKAAIISDIEKILSVRLNETDT